MKKEENELVDVLIVGAGLAGVGSACQLRRRSPELSFIILESRAVSGGTWDLFRYPGIRSDSDLVVVADMLIEVILVCRFTNVLENGITINDGRFIYPRLKAITVGVHVAVRTNPRVAE